ncbi:MAG: DMT family transporter [Aquabacterium sp.]|nr:DMT family transporter [Aquabacterium sp.]
MNDPDALRMKGLLCAAAGAIAFSGKAIVAKLMYRYGVDAFTVVGLRMLLALPFFTIMAWWASRPQGGVAAPTLDMRTWCHIVGLGFCGYYLASILDFLGLQYISASLERAVMYLNPTLVLLLGVVFLGDRPRPAQVGAVLLAYAGVAVVWLHDWDVAMAPVAGASTAGLGAVQAMTVGSLLVFLSALSYAVYLMGSVTLVRRIGSSRLVGLASMVACVFALLQWAVVAWSDHAVVAWLPHAPSMVVLQAQGEGVAGLPWEVWSLSLVNAVVCTVLPVWLVMRGVQWLGPQLASQVGMVGPLSTLWMAAVVLGEPVTWRLMLGTGLILLGIVWLTRAGHRHTR